MAWKTVSFLMAWLMNTAAFAHSMIMSRRPASCGFLKLASVCPKREKSMYSRGMSCSVCIVLRKGFVCFARKVY